MYIVQLQVKQCAYDAKELGATVPLYNPAHWLARDVSEKYFETKCTFRPRPMPVRARGCTQAQSRPSH
jgi:hypothetical protein